VGHSIQHSKTVEIFTFRSESEGFTSASYQEIEKYSGGNYVNVLDWSLYTCLTQLYGGTDIYNLLHKEQLHVSALFIGHLQVDK